MTEELGELVQVDPRKVWESEPNDFTPWLARPENLRVLGKAIGLNLEPKSTEEPVGPFRADILARELMSDTLVVIENQLERTDHLHLGQLLTYAAGLDTVTVVWVAREFTEDHRAALDWLNEHIRGGIRFFGLEIELWRIGDSKIAPKFNVVCEPNNWSRTVEDAAGAELTESKALQLEYWTAFRTHLQSRSPLRTGKPQPQNWMTYPIGRNGMFLATVASLYDNEANKFGGENRVEFVIASDDAGELFDTLQKSKDVIERELNGPLTWQSTPGVKQKKVFVRRSVDLRDRSAWLDQHEWMRVNLEAFKAVFSKWVQALPR